MPSTEVGKAKVASAAPVSSAAPAPAPVASPSASASTMSSPTMSERAKSIRAAAPPKPPGVQKLINCQEVRTVMLGASAVQLFMSIVIVVIGASALSMCVRRDRFGNWAMVYGAFLFACSAATTAAVFGRQRRAALFALGLGVTASLFVLIIDGIGYFCVDLRDGANRETPMCQSHIDQFNACAWVTMHKKGSSHLQGGQGLRLTLLIFIVLFMISGVGIMTTALTEAGRLDMCQFEEALRELKETNAQLSYGRRARRNRILTKYISEAKPEEGQGYGTKIMRFFGFGTDVDPIPMAERKVKFVLPKGAVISPASSSEPPVQ